jgi:hypothetical protein
VEIAMQEYETRIIDRTGALFLLVTDRHLSDFTAIRAALRLCKEGDTTQVWRGDECVYSDAPRKRTGPLQPVSLSRSEPGC